MLLKSQGFTLGAEQAPAFILFIYLERFLAFMWFRCVIWKQDKDWEEWREQGEQDGGGRKRQRH